MKISLLISLLLLSTLLHEVQGIRLGKGFISKRKDQEFQKEEEDTTDLIKRSKGGGGVNEEEVVCKDGQCSGLLNRKLITKKTPTPSPMTPITAPCENNKLNDQGNKADPKLNGKSSPDGEEEILSVNSSSPVSEHRPEAASKQYPDTLDVAEMDYSPARRKSPIHN